MITSDKDNKKKRMCHGFMTHPLFFSSDFTDESEAGLLIGLLTDFRRYLAAGQWAHARYVLLLFLVTQISQMTQIFLRGIIFVTQISQMTQIFLRGIILSHRFHRFTQIFLRGIIFGHADFADDADFSS